MWKNERLTSFQPFQPSFSQRVGHPRGGTGEASCPLSCSAHCGMPHHPYPSSGAACSRRKQGSHGTWALSSLSFQPGFPWSRKLLCAPFLRDCKPLARNNAFRKSHSLFFFFYFFSVVVHFTLPSYLNSHHRF